MAEKADDLISTVSAIRIKVAQTEREEAAKLKLRQTKAEEEKAELLKRLSMPSGVDDEERLKRAASIINSAVHSGLTRVEIGRFPNKLCTDNGRAVNQQEPGWEKTLTGLPLEIFQFWKKHLEPRGYEIKYQIKEYVGGMPGDVAITLSWEERLPT